MRDISHKITTLRSATAGASLKISMDTFKRLQLNDLPKGDPLPVAKVAAIQAAKQTERLIPYCHPIPIEGVDVRFNVEPDTICIEVTVKAVYKTGVEMEALTAVSAAALTLYDMLKMVDDALEITNVRLLKKTGGKSDGAAISDHELKAAVLTISDSVSSGDSFDQSGRLIMDRLREYSMELVDYTVLPDEPADIIRKVEHCTDILNADLVITTGGTGLGPRDNTPEALDCLIDKDIPGLSEMLRAYGQARTPYAMLSRAKAGLRGKCLVISLPGSRQAVQDAMDALFPYLLHSFHIVQGGKHASQNTVGSGRS